MGRKKNNAMTWLLVVLLFACFFDYHLSPLAIVFLVLILTSDPATTRNDDEEDD